MTFKIVDQVESYIKETLFDTFELEQQIFIVNTHNGVYYEKNSDPIILHLIFANDYSEEGKYYNKYIYLL